MTYLLDTNIFVETKKRFAPIDVGLSFWAKVEELAKAGTIASVDKVKDELATGKDDLSKWVKSNLPKAFFVNTTTVAIMQQYSKLMSWAQGSTNYLPTAKSEFAQATIADPFLIAYAATDPGNIKIVTDEISEPNRRNRVKIPDAAKAFNVDCITMVEMFRELKETF